MIPSEYSKRSEEAMLRMMVMLLLSSVFLLLPLHYFW